MNVFILDKNIKRSAQMLDDAHLLAQISEGCQILMANYNHVHYPNARIGHLNHPVTKFYSDAKPMEELLSYLSELFNEYLLRFGKEHQNFFWLIGFTEDMSYNTSNYFSSSKTFIEDHFTDNIEEIRNYIMTKPHVRRLKWTNAKKPSWWVEE